jgi:hypothetical protein
MLNEESARLSVINHTEARMGIVSLCLPGACRLAEVEPRALEPIVGLQQDWLETQLHHVGSGCRSLLRVRAIGYLLPS